MPFVVCKCPMEHVQDTTGVETAMKQWNFGADAIVAVVGKTEGNGGVNDISRILVDRVMRDFFVPYVRLRAKQPGYAVSIVKAGAEIVRRSAGTVRPPLQSLNVAEYNELEDLIAKLGSQN